MPKQKTHRGAAKRFGKTASGQLKRKRAYTSHLCTHKSQKQHRKLRKIALVSKPELKRISILIPYK